MGHDPRCCATRIERLKYLSRNQPELPATLELSADEIEVLKRDQASRGVKEKRVVPASPTLADVTRWIAELGGWIDRKGNGPRRDDDRARPREAFAQDVRAPSYVSPRDPDRGLSHLGPGAHPAGLPFAPSVGMIRN